MTPLNAFIDHLHEAGILLNPGATDSDLNSLETLLGEALPSEIRDFYSVANGIPESELAPHMVGFWSIQRIHDEFNSWADGQVGFADVMISSWRFIFRSTPKGVCVFTENVSPGSPLREIGSFDSFLTAYITDPESLDLA